MIIDTAQDWFFLSVIVLFIFTAISWITFARLSMRPIEKRMKHDGVLNDFRWDGVGARIFSYAFAIVFPEKLALRLNRLMDVQTIRGYTRKADWTRGLIFLTTTYLWLAILLTGIALGYADYTPKNY